jgi:phage I-like protein
VFLFSFTGVIIAFRSPLTLPAGKELPTRLKIAHWGRNEAVDVTPIVNETSVACIPHNQRISHIDTAILDFNHNTLPGSEAYKAEKEPRNIAAKGKLEVVPFDGVYFSALEWTPEGQAAYLGGHFPDISPAVKMNDAGEVIFIHSAGLVQQGSINGLHAFSVGGLPTMKTATSTQSTMDIKKLLLAILGLPETATDIEIETAAKAWAAKANASNDAGEEVKAFSATLKAINDRLDARERSELVAAAIADGKIIPLGVEVLPLANFKTMIESLPKDQVPLEKRTPEGIKAFTAPGFSHVATTESAAAEAEVNRQLGIKADA